MYILYASLTFQKLPNQIHFMLSLPLYLQRIHNKKFERNLLHLRTAASCLSLSECLLGIYSVFILFLLALYLLWDNFLISEMTSIHVNNTTNKILCQPQSAHSLGMLITENITIQRLHDFRLRMRCK
jgi:hypothetical protein